MLDEHGWADVGELIDTSRQKGMAFSRADLEEVVVTARNPAQWKGGNLPGFALMEVREMLK